MNTLFGLHARRIRPEGRARRRSATRLPRFETLERRELLAANLHADSISVTEGAVVGEQSLITARFKSTDLVAGSRFNVQLLIDGQVLQTQTRTAIAGVNQAYAFAVNWFARPGQIELRLDTGNVIAESDETDNVAALAYTPAAPVLTSKFVSPIYGEQADEWFISNYLDVDLRSVQFADFRGGKFTYDGHTGVDYSLGWQFPVMDAGVPIFAVAAGTVKQVQDGRFDRQASNPDELANSVIIDHGGGWETLYWHLAANSVSVTSGQVVAAGQMIGLTGSSGTSTGPHLHFEVHHNSRSVETYFAPTSYWILPATYSGDIPSFVQHSGITNYAFATEVVGGNQPTEIKEGPSDVRLFPTSAAWDASYWAILRSLRANDVLQLRWYGPDGTLEHSQEQILAADFTYMSSRWSLESARWSQFPGAWHVALAVNGREIDRQSFEVTTGPGVPEIRLTQGDTYVIDGRTTPIDFGTASATPRALTFTIQNHGSVELTTSGLELPPGFSLIGAFPASVSPGTTANFQVQLDAATPGPKFGQVRFRTNDADEGDFDFNIQGIVSGAVPAATPQIALAGPAVVFINSAEPRLIAATGSVFDSDSTNFNTGQLKVEFASGGTNDDRLAIRNQGTAAGLIGVAGDSVTFGGVSIGSFSGVQGTTPLIVTLNANASPAVVGALVRNLTFANVSRQPTTNHRYVRLTLVDDTGKISNMAIAHVLVDPRFTQILGDLNGDGLVNQMDVGAFSLALTNPTAYAQQYAWVDRIKAGDINQDGKLNNLDIGPFRALVRQTEAAVAAAQALAVQPPAPLPATALPVTALAGSLVDKVLVDPHDRLTSLRSALSDDLTTLLAHGRLRERITHLSHGGR